MRVVFIEPHTTSIPTPPPPKKDQRTFGAYLGLTLTGVVLGSVKYGAPHVGVPTPEAAARTLAGGGLPESRSQSYEPWSNSS